MSVSREDLEAHIERVASRVKNPQHGLFGPGSMVWQINREVMNILAGGRALLLQTAHPFVARGVEEHSNTTTDPHGRFKRTYINIAAVVFGTLEDATMAARRVHALHGTIKGKMIESVGRYQAGSDYEANLQPGLLWVHATLWDSAVLVYEQTVRPLTLAEKDQYWEEGRLFAHMFGVSNDTLPPDWTQFQEYCHKMWESDELGVSKAGREVANWALVPPTPIFGPAMWLYKIVTAGLLPPRFREEFGFRWTAADKLIFKSFMLSAKLANPFIIPTFRYVPAYADAARRVKGLKGRAPLSEYRENWLMSLLEARSPKG